MKKITVTLNDEAERFFNEIMYSLPKPGTEGDLCTQSDAINHALISLSEMEDYIEKMNLCKTCEELSDKIISQKFLEKYYYKD